MDSVAGAKIDLVMSAVRQRIAGRVLAPGARLPSIRQMATSQKVSTSTVVEAYQRLAAEGEIRPRAGSGFYVAQQVGAFSPAEAGPKLDRAIDPFWISRQSLEVGPEGLKPGCGWLPPDWMPHEPMRKALRKLARAETPGLVEYSSPLGLPALRQLLGRRLAEFGVETGLQQILLTDSGTSSLDLICRMMLEPGDVVLVDDPCYFNFQALLRAHRVKIVSTPYTPVGPDIDQFATALREHRPKLYITNSATHNPTGATLSMANAHRILRLAEEFDLTVVEDDIMADFELKHAPRLAALDGLQRVLSVGSFTKTVSAAARCGFIAAKPEWIERLADLKIATAFGGGRLNAELALAVLGDSSYRKHIDDLIMRLAAARIAVAAQLKQLGIEPWTTPQAGMLLWCRLPDGLDAANVARAALRQGMVLAPGNAFSLTQTATDYMRFNVSQMGDPRVYDLLAGAMEAAR